MINIRKAEARGHFDHGWLNTYHTFSFGDYYDKQHMGFRELRVINEDRVEPAAGFPTHAHRDMEIITYVIDGALQHKDSMGNGSVIRPGDVQRMSAGTGVTHSEYNQSRLEPVHFLQIWLLPDKQGIEPGYEQKAFTDAVKRDRLCLIAGRDGRQGAVTIHQDVDVYAARLSAGKTVSHVLRRGRHAWIQVVEGEVEVNGQALGSGDGAALSDEASISLQAKSEAELLLFDLA